MLITSVTLKNWKNFREVTAGLGRRVFLIGPNASGKSNFLDALRFLQDVSDIGLAQAVDKRGGITSIRCLAARKDSEVAVQVKLDNTWEYALALGGTKARPLTVLREVARYHDPESGWNTVLERPDKEDNADPARLTQTAMEQVNANKEFRAIPEFFKSIVYRHILPQAVRDAKGFSSIPLQNDPFGRDFILQVWNTSKKSRDSRLGKIEKVLRLAVPQLGNLGVEMDPATGTPHLVAKYIHWRPQGARQDESALSDGTLRLLALLWSLLEDEGPLLLEEPELSLHDEVVRQLPDMFAKLGRRRKSKTRQVIVSTHSEAMLRAPGIGPMEVLRLAPTENGTEILPTTPEDAEFMRKSGLSAADVLMPKTKAPEFRQLSFLDL
jgi:predicted ATPase